MRVGFFQFHPHFGRVDDNLQQIEQALNKQDSALLVLPELCLTGYLFRDRAQLLALAEDPRSSPSLDRLQALCVRRGLHLVLGFAERDDDKLYNSAVLIGPTGLIARYRKPQLFGGEKRLFDPGDGPLEPVNFGASKLGLMLCFDWAFPEIARRLALRGAEIICHPSNLVLDHGQGAMRTRSIENAVYTVTANRFGCELRQGQRLCFTGGSQIVDPNGQLLAQAPGARQMLKIVDLDLSKARDKHITPQNHRFDDRRLDLYPDLT